MKKQRRFWINDVEALTCIMIILIIIGAINICSASLITAYTDFENPYYFLLRHIISIFIGLLCFISFSRFNYKRLARLNWQIGLIVLTILSLTAVLLIGITVNGSKRWLPLGFMQFQPSELAKIITIIISSSYLGKCLDKKLPITVNPRKNIVFVVCMIIAGFVEAQPDMGTAMIIIGIPVILYFIAGLDKKLMGVICGLGAIILAFLATFQPYRLDRLKSYFDPWSYSQNEGYQIVQSILAIGSGEFSGMGLGNGFSKYFYLPESHTDFAFAIFCQENGFIGALIIFFLLIAMAFYFIKIALRTRDNFGKMLVCGIMLLIAGQSVANIAMVVGLLPVIGFPLPFISYGGTSLILNMTCMGLVLSVARHNKAVSTNTSVKYKK